MRKPLTALALAVCLMRAVPAHPQAVDGGPDPNNVRVRIGPVMMNPTISVSNIGIDHNVFNDPPGKLPKEDFVLTVTPLIDVWVPLGPTWLTGGLVESINWFQEFASERGVNNMYRLGWKVPGSHMSFKIDGSYANSRDRPGFEIDTRAERTETGLNGAFDFRALSKSFVGLTASRLQTDFVEDAEYNGTNLRTSLNRVDTAYGVNFRHQLTPLTSITLGVIRSSAQFEFSPDRDTNSTSVNMTASFTPEALVRGGFSFGFDDFTPADPALPGYRGMIGSADLTYVLLGSTRFALNGGRSVQYSYDEQQPYYVQSRIGGSVAQQIFGPVDVQVRGDVAYLAYRNRAGADVAVPDRTDRVVTYGIGLGLHMGRDLRLSFNVDQSNRDTKVFEHQYERLLVGTSLTYGF